MASAVSKPPVKKSGPVAKPGGRRQPSAVQRLFQYFRESWAECRRATWPAWPDLRKLTTAVFSGIIVVTLYIYVLDVILAAVTRFVTQSVFGLRS